MCAVGRKEGEKTMGQMREIKVGKETKKWKMKERRGKFDPVRFLTGFLALGPIYIIAYDHLTTRFLIGQS